MNTYIDKEILGYHIASHQVAWQERGGVMCVSHGVNDPSYNDIAALWDTVPYRLRAVTRDEMIPTAFSVLATWSRKNEDVLLNAGENLLMCIPRLAYDKLVECKV